MITVKSLKWSNWFSYGADNFIDFTTAPLMQIAGTNGSGKSSIPLILEEVLYGKNHVGKRKQTLVNRYLDNPVLNAEIIFLSDNVEYKIKISRKTTVKIQFFRENEDLSSHTATNTYKTIQNVLGIEFKVFIQLIYQSAKINLEFLEATDTNRKKFLISLFNLNKYLSIHDVFKKLESKTNTELATLRGKLSTIEVWITNHINDDLTISTKQDLPEVNTTYVDSLAEHKSKLINIRTTNTKVNKNNQYIELLSTLDLEPLSYTVEIPKGKKEKLTNKRELQHKITENNTKVSTFKSSIAKIKKLDDRCPSCHQGISEDIKEGLVTTRINSISKLEDSSSKITADIKDIDNAISVILDIESKINKKRTVTDEFSRLQGLIDKSVPTEVLIELDVKEDMVDLENRINNINTKIREAVAYNSKVEKHNSKVAVIIEQLAEYDKQAATLRLEVIGIEEKQGHLSILKKAFSTNGLLNYKLEYLIKDLEDQINSYLQELSSGKFQILFVLEGEKLNIDILDEGLTVGIEELSAGELARINTATLLAIRKLMSAISSTKLNILFLDEVMGVLDDEGKEKLIEVLHKEEGLNTFLVSHEYSHPLIPKINIIKEDKISRIDNEI